MLNCLMIIFIFLPIFSSAQTDSLVLKEQLQEDFLVYRKSLEEAHPGLYWYRSKFEMDSIFDEAYKKLDQSMTEKQFFTLLSSVTAKIGCLHTVIRVCKAFEKAEINPEAKTFPFEIKLDKNRLFIYQNLSNDTTISEGTEIMAVNGKTASYLVPFFVDKISNDGFGDHWSRYALETSFRYYLHIFFGESTSFQLTFKDDKGNKRTTSVPSRSEKERFKILQKRYPHSAEPEHVISLKFHEETKSAILKITRFDNWKIKGKKYKFRKVLKKKMNELVASNVSNLILDVGDRGGGNELWGLDLLSYFLKEPYKAYKAVEFKTLDYSISKKYSNTSWFEYNLLKLLLNFERSDSTWNWKNYRGLKPYTPKKNGFHGNIYLLVSGATASATSDFAAWVDELKLVTIVGTETGGSYLGNTSNWEFTVELPNTQLRLLLPLARYLTNVEERALGRGIIPNHIVPSTIQDKLGNVDTQLNYVLNIIKKKQVEKMKR
ncbi:MAG: S41 family peptidase [Bacteroidota bacterium]